MSAGARLWLAAAAASLACHAALGLLVATATRPEPLSQQPAPQARLMLAAYDVQRADAVAARPASPAAPEAEVAAAALSQDAIPRVAAALRKPVAAAATQALAPAPVPIAASAAPAARLAAASPPRAEAPEAIPAAPVLAALPPDDPPIAAGLPEPAAAPALPLAPATATPALPPRAEAPEAIVAAPVLVALPPGDPAIGARLPPATNLGPTAPSPDRPVPSLPLIAVAVPASAVSQADRVVTAQAPQPDVLEAAVASAEAARAGRPVAVSVILGAPEVTAGRSAPVGSAAASALQPPSVGAAIGKPPGQSLGARDAPATPVPGTAPAEFADDLPPAAPRAERIAAALAWSGGAEARVDPVSLAAIAAFVTGGDAALAAGGSVRDGIAGLLAQVPCAQLQAAFDPEAGALELRGHVPEDDLRTPVLAALRAQVGASIPVVDRLLILPRPQCAALAGIAATGLPRSTEQDTNPLLVGPDAHARHFRYTEGERLIFEATAPDYDAWLYVDYFDAQGQVVHLAPNAEVRLERHPAKSVVQVGADRPDGGALRITIGPPYGQEIAAAFATSAPLYDGVRPTVEPAAAYLDWLAGQVATVRATDSGFRGEWVYYFVSTLAGE